MGTLNYSFSTLFPVRKISPTILLKPHRNIRDITTEAGKEGVTGRIYVGRTFYEETDNPFSRRRHNRLPTKLHECIDSPSPNTVFCRPFLVLILLFPVVFYFYHINRLEFHTMSALDPIILPTNNTNHVNLTKGTDKTMEIFDDVTKDDNSGEIFDDATEDTGLDNVKIDNKTDILPHGLPVCEINETYKNAGNLTINYNVSREAAFVSNPLVAMGGYYKPSKCQTRHKIAILVPYRHREENLAIFLTNIHQFLMNQQIEYRIYIIEQSGTEKFNKGRLLNAGFDQIKDYWECFIFHDVDLLPLDPRILYTCPSYPRYMSTKVYEGGKIVKLTQFFGGVTAMTDQHFLAVNGYSNRFWGWGGEDNDMYWRIRVAKLPIMKYNKDIARYIMLPHVTPEKNLKRYDILNKYSKSRANHIEDGISTLKYAVVFKKLYSLFTHIVVDVNPYKDLVE